MKPEISPDLALRAQRGAARLDKTAPGWAEKLNVKLLDLRSCTQCVLGQLYGGYSRGIEATGWPLRTLEDHFNSYEIALAHGFTVGITSPERWSALRAAWLVEINRRLAKPTKPARPTRPKRAVALTAAVPMLCTV